MPDQYGRLTVEDHQKIQSWWMAHWKAPVICPVCKTGEWAISDHMLAMHRNAVDAFVGPAYLMVMVECKACAHAMFFNAVHMGVVPPYDPMKQEQFAQNLLTAPQIR